MRGYGPPPAFPARVGPVQVLAAAGVQLGRGHAITLPVIAFAQPPVMQHRDRGLAEGNRGCLGGADQVGAEHGGDVVADAAAPQLPRLNPALFRQLAGQPAGGTPLLVVHGHGVGLKDQLDGHQPTLRPACRDTPQPISDGQPESVQDRRVYTRLTSGVIVIADLDTLLTALYVELTDRIISLGSPGTGRASRRR